jgi:L-lactate dehydrogenase complex protein LldE
MTRPRVALFVTCLVDVFRPRIAEATVALLERCGFDVEVPAQACCGQVNANGGDRAGATALALGVVDRFSGYENIVVPSGSCAGFIRNNYPGLCKTERSAHEAALAMSSRVQELTQFLTVGARQQELPGKWNGTVVYHDSCSCRRELGISREPRALLAQMSGLELREMPDAEDCCGFGGLFSTSYPEISVAMADRKIESVLGSGADCVVGADAGCLMHLEGRMRRRGIRKGVLHVAEVLNGMRPEDAND